MNKLTKVLATTALVVGSAYVIKRILDGDVIQDKFREKAALDYLKEKYGDDVMEGKKIQIINDDSHADKVDIAKDIADYNMHKED